ncbi:MAG: DUF1616 domain-containing protein [Dehalococcoidales bacterium]|nr:MAG: DUF1616 domain-containing protein [Dehalococcoidales bacterium]
MDTLSPIIELFNWAVPVLDYVPVIRAILGIVLVFFAPGFAWTLVLFKQINHIERLVLSFALSLTLVTLSILGLNAVIDMRITGLNALLTILLLTFIPLIIHFIRKYRQKRKMPQIEEE